MKISFRKVFMLLVIILSLTAVQAVWAGTCNVTVSGEITAIYSEENAITVNDVTVYGIPLAYLAKKLKIVLQVGDSVVVTARSCPSTDRLSACTLSVNGGDVISLPGGRSR